MRTEAEAFELIYEKIFAHDGTACTLCTPNQMARMQYHGAVRAADVADQRRRAGQKKRQRGDGENATIPASSSSTASPKRARVGSMGTETLEAKVNRLEREKKALQLQLNRVTGHMNKMAKGAALPWDVYAENAAWGNDDQRAKVVNEVDALIHARCSFLCTGKGESSSSSSSSVQFSSARLGSSSRRGG